jgi:hypothetical protein
MLPFEDLFDVDYVTILATKDVAASLFLIEESSNFLSL